MSEIAAYKAGVFVTVGVGSPLAPALGKVTGGSPAWFEVPATGPTVDAGGDTVDVTNLKNNAGWRKKLKGLHDWSVSADSIYSAGDTGLKAVRDAYFARSKLWVMIVPECSVDASGVKTVTSVNAAEAYTGEIIVENFNPSFEQGGTGSISISLQGTGAMKVGGYVLT